ncbi:tyrosine-type recombinase/integrase [Rhodovulum sulfidophilum]|uniref:tyrosine-type recombinase/integrase n=1 Tax=Rhodovulum sulfidophilum TaxID=35806 RepID=UPI00192925ED|nr:tyrosine-type recombinase/integrase [Rhodovulum sulfidophilum]MBL3587091.1 tyrosine-type recombinase/integrase [Rhodovulum sulfidophilum]
MLDDIRGRYGTGLVRDLRPHHIRADLEGRPPHPANNRLKCWRGLCRWWQEAGLAEEDAASPVRTRRVLPTEGHLPWSRDDIAKFRARWPHATSQRLAFELLFWTGARMSDAVRLGPGMVDADGWLSYRQSKTGGKVDVPFTAAAPEWAEPSDRVHLFSALREQADRHAVWMVTAQGRPRSIKAASQWFSAAARATGITGGRSAHGLRKTRAQIMAERGATPDQRAAWLGHESLSEVQHYSRGADRRRMLAGTDPEPQSSNSSDRVPTWMRK